MRTIYGRRQPIRLNARIVGVIALTLVLVPIGIGQYRGSGVQTVLRAMKAEAVLKIPAKDFELKDLDGTQVRLSDFRGKESVLLYFWASWCPSCIAIKPQVAKLRSDVGRDRLEILAINPSSWRVAASKLVSAPGFNAK